MKRFIPAFLVLAATVLLIAWTPVRDARYYTNVQRFEKPVTTEDTLGINGAATVGANGSIDISSGSFKVDTIAESTAGSGVTVDGVLLKDNSLSVPDTFACAVSADETAYLQVFEGSKGPSLAAYTTNGAQFISLLRDSYTFTLSADGTDSGLSIFTVDENDAALAVDPLTVTHVTGVDYCATTIGHALLVKDGVGASADITIASTNGILMDGLPITFTNMAAESAIQVKGATYLNVDIGITGGQGYLRTHNSLGVKGTDQTSDLVGGSFVTYSGASVEGARASYNGFSMYGNAGWTGVVTNHCVGFTNLVYYGGGIVTNVSVLF